MQPPVGVELAADASNGNLVTDVAASALSAIRLAGLDLALLVAAENGGLATVNEVIASRAP